MVNLTEPFYGIEFQKTKLSDLTWGSNISRNVEIIPNPIWIIGSIHWSNSMLPIQIDSEKQFESNPEFGLSEWIDLLQILRRLAYGQKQPKYLKVIQMIWFYLTSDSV